MDFRTRPALRRLVWGVFRISEHEVGSGPAPPMGTAGLVLIAVLLGSCLAPAALEPAEAGDAPPPVLLIPRGETYVTRTTDLSTGEYFLDTTYIASAGEGNLPAYLVRRSGEKGTTLIYMAKQDLRPFRYEALGADGRIEKQIDFGEDAISIAVRGQPDTLIIETSGPVHTGSTLMHYLRAFAARPGPGRLETKLLVPRGRGKYRVVDVFAKRVGFETLSVPAGDFRCVKIEFGLSGIIGRLFWRTRYYYFYTAEAPHHFVKYFDPDGETIELVEYECAGGVKGVGDN